MKKIVEFAVLASMPLLVSAGDVQPPVVSVDEPSVFSLVLMSLIVMGAIMLRNKFKK